MDANSNILTYMAYGDALGFSRENSNNEFLQPFSYSYSDDVKLQAEVGQWSYLTQLILINCKCLVDNKSKRQVSIDYKRMIQEVKLWNHYRCGIPSNYMCKLKLGNLYYEDEFYWNDKRGEAFSRVIPIILANKNFNVAQEEVYKNIIYINRHPQVVLTGLLLLRTIYFLLNNKTIQKEELIDEIKSYLINLQLVELEECVNGELPNNYKIKFEQEKINYLIDLDRLKNIETYSYVDFNSKDIFIGSLICFFKLNADVEDTFILSELKEKEIYLITYGLLAITKKTNQIHIDKIKDVNFIKNMDDYLFKLREYEVGRTFFEKTDNKVELFNLNKGSVMKHPLLNNIRIKDKKEFDNYIELIVESRSGEYKLIRQKK